MVQVGLAPKPTFFLGEVMKNGLAHKGASFAI